MTECRIIPTDLPPARPNSYPPSMSPSTRSSFSGEDDEDDNKENLIVTHDRLPHSPTDKLLSPVSRALKAQKKSPKRGVRTSLTSLMDATA